MRPRARLQAPAVLLLAVGSLLLGRHGYLGAKAVVAEHLIGRALEAHLVDGGDHPPWSWADTTPLASLEVARLGVHRYVLAGASGTSLAFGVGHVDGTARPNAPGNCVLAGHRDRWFHFLGDLRPGDVIRLRSAGATRDYVVERFELVRADAADVLDPTPDDRLTLVTCYPFDGLLPSSRRFVVTCRVRKIHQADAIASS